MNWLVVEDNHNRFSIQPQYLLSLSECCTRSLYRSIESCCRIANQGEHGDVELFAQIQHYLKETVPASILPHWITNKLLPRILANANFPTEYFNGILTNTFCSITEATLTQQDPVYLTNRLSHLSTFALTSLNLSESAVTDAHILSLGSSVAAVSLNILKLRKCVDFHEIDSLKSFRNLTHLDISENTLSFNEQNPLGMLCLLTKYFPNLLFLDLHFTNFIQLFCSEIDAKIVEESCNKFLSELSPTPALRELYLYSNVDLNSTNSPLLNKFYTSLHRFSALTDLDLSGWPEIAEISDSELAKMSDGLSFLGIWCTDLTLSNSSRDIRSKEISGFENEDQIITTLEHYSDVQYYMHMLYKNLFKGITKNIFQLNSAEKIAIHMYKSLDRFLHVKTGANFYYYYFLHFTECLFAVTHEVMLITPELLSLGLNTCITFLNIMNDACEILQTHIAHLCFNVCCTCALLTEGEICGYKDESMGYVLCQFLLNLINRLCDNPTLLISNNTYHYQLLNKSLEILESFRVSRSVEQKIILGTKFEFTKTMVKLITMKIEDQTLDEQIIESSRSLMFLTHRSQPNCVELLKQMDSTLLKKIIEVCTDEEQYDVLGYIMASVKNIAECCLKDDTVKDLCLLLPPVISILNCPNKYTRSMLGYAIAVSTYYAVGAVKWHWDETGEEAVRLAIKAIEQTDYETPNFLCICCQEDLLECFHVEDTRVQFCALWLICNFVNRESEVDSILVQESDILNSIFSNPPQDSQSDITVKLAQVFNLLP